MKYSGVLLLTLNSNVSIVDFEQVNVSGDTFNGSWQFDLSGSLPNFTSNINPFLTNIPLLYPRKTSKNLRFSDVFREYRSGTVAENGLSKFK